MKSEPIPDTDIITVTITEQALSKLQLPNTKYTISQHLPFNSCIDYFYLFICCKHFPLVKATEPDPHCV